MNIVLMIGKIANQIRTFYTEKGLCVVRFNIRVNKNVRKSATSIAPPYDTFNCVAFGKYAEGISNFANEGDEIMVKGKLAISTYDNKEQQKVYITEIQVQEMKYLETPKTLESSEDAGFSEMGQVDIPF